MPKQKAKRLVMSFHTLQLQFYSLMSLCETIVRTLRVRTVYGNSCRKQNLKILPLGDAVSEHLETKTQIISYR